MFNNILFHSQNRLTLPKSKGFGRLYNWYAASSRSLGILYNRYTATDTRNIAPIGWHVPSMTEFDTLITYLGGASVAGGKLKETGVTYWDSSNTGATNEVGFNCIATKFRNVDGTFATQLQFICWTSTISGIYGFAKAIQSSSNTIFGEVPTSSIQGCCIRLIKDDSTDTGIMTGNDGKQYATVKIGTQVWMAENLEETKFRNGDTIPVVTDNAAWAALTTAGSCWYNNTRTYNLAPVGWHLPNFKEWEILIINLGGVNVAGGKLKEIGLTHWNAPNIGATNEIEFTALGGGYRNTSFLAIKMEGVFRISDGEFEGLDVYLNNTTEALTILISEESTIIGASIRFIRNKNSILTTNPIDSEGNAYETVNIGTQTWTKQNHKSKKWRTGESINVQDIYTDSAWAALIIPACCAYNNDENNV